MSAPKRRNRQRSSCPRSEATRRRDVLFFTQELSTLLNSGVPLDRALSITSELTTRAQFRTIVLDILRSIKGGKSLADSLALHPAYFSELFINMVRAGEASGSLGQIFERLSEFERSRDELRSFIVSAMIYPALLALRGRRRDFRHPRFCGSALRLDLRRRPHEDSAAYADHAAGKPYRAGLVVGRGARCHLR